MDDLGDGERVGLGRSACNAVVKGIERHPRQGCTEPAARLLRHFSGSQPRVQF